MSENSGFIYGKFRDYVDKQIDTRQRIFSKEERTPEDLLYLNGKTAWIKMTSAVNFNEQSSIGKQYGLYGDEIAKQYQMFGGVLWKNKILDSQGQTKEYDSLRTGFGSSKNKGLNSNINYGLGGYTEAGFRPMPGIESISVKPKNQFGSLREATVNFKCWNLEQLNILESLYMRPGYQVLLEWGHSIYYDNTEKLITGNKIKYVDFFNVNYKIEDILKEIDSIKFNACGNYDGLLGIVKNFSITANADGSYNCVTNLVTWGEIVESLKISIAPTNNDINQRIGIDKKVENKKIDGASSTFLEAILNRIKDVIKDPTNSKQIESELAPYLDSTSYWEMDSNSNLYSQKTEFVSREQGWVAPCYLNIDDPQTSEASYFITLRDILSLINNICLIKDQNKNNILTINNSIDNNFALTNPLHFSVDPRVCIFPSGYPGIINPSKGIIDRNDFVDSPNVQKFKFMKLFINIDYVIRTLNENTNKETLEVNLLSFLNSLMNGISSSMGNLNEYQIYINEFNTINIIDAQLIPLNYGNPSTLVLSRKDKQTFGFCYDYSFSSRITNKLGTTLAVSAQANNNSLNLDNTAFSKLNIGLEDRFARSKNVPITDDEAMGKSQAFNFLKEFSKGWDISYDSSTYYAEFTSSPENISKAKKYLKDILNSVKNSIGEGSAFIPIDLNVSLEGISGMRIGECFLIETEKLPRNYLYAEGGLPKIKFLVRTLEHVVNNNIWRTNVVALSVTNQKAYKTSSNVLDDISKTIYPFGYIPGEDSNQIQIESSRPLPGPIQDSGNTPPPTPTTVNTSPWTYTYSGPYKQP